LYSHLSSAFGYPFLANPTGTNIPATYLIKRFVTTRLAVDTDYEWDYPWLMADGVTFE
jgi:hypothetical protein